MNCQEINDVNSTMIYAFERKVYAKELGRQIETRELIEFKGYVSGLAVYNNYLYVSVNSNKSISLNSTIWRFPKLSHTSSFDIDKSVIKQFQELRTVSEDILSIAVAKGYVYAGRSDGILWRCSTEQSDSCEDFHQLGSMKEFEDQPVSSKARIGEVNYNPSNDRIYVVKSVRTDSLLVHFMWHCSMTTPETCDFIDTINLGGWANVLNAFDAFDAMWIADFGVLKKCPQR